MNESTRVVAGYMWPNQIVSVGELADSIDGRVPVRIIQLDANGQIPEALVEQAMNAMTSQDWDDDVRACARAALNSLLSPSISTSTQNDE